MKTKPKRAVKKDRVKTLSSTIWQEYREMKGLYKDQKFDDLARFLERRAAVIVTPDYKKLRGGASARFWAKEHGQGAKLDFRTVNIFLGGGSGVHGDSQKTFDSIAFITHEVHLKKNSGARRKNATGYMETSGKHQTDCTWFEY